MKSPEESSDLTAGYGVVDITPPVGEFGSFRLAPNKRSLGVHDPLYAKALYLKCAEEKLVLVSLDCVGLMTPAIEKLHNAIQSVVELNDEQILIAATHTHNGAESLCEEPIANYDSQIDRFADGAARAAQTAVENRFPARAGWGKAHAPGVAKNRFQARLAGGDVDKVDDRIDFLKIDDADGNHKGILWHFAAHATTCMMAGFQSSADYYGVVNRLVEAQLGGFSVFFNGACGNINPVLGERTFEKAEATGRQVADSLIAAVPGTETRNRLELGSNRAQIETPLSEKRKALVLPDDREEIMDYFAKIESLELHTKEEYGRFLPDYNRLRVSWWRHRLVEEFGGVDSNPVLLGGLRIGDHLILAVPGEIFIEHQFELQEAFKDTRAMIFGYANGYVGYIPHPESFEIDAYETTPTYVQRAGKYAGRMITEKGIALLKAL